MAESKEMPAVKSSREEEHSSRLDEVSKPLVSPDEAEKGFGEPGGRGGGGGHGGGSSAVFNRTDRPPRDVVYGRIFIVATVLLVLREVITFFVPVLMLKFFDPDTFTLQPLVCIVTGLVLSIPGCFLLLWASRKMSRGTVQICLVLCAAFFAVSLVLVLALHRPPTAGTEEYDPNLPPAGSLPGSQLGDLRGQRSHQPVGALGDESETSLLEAAIPGSISRILRVTASISARSRHVGIAMSALPCQHCHVGNATLSSPRKHGHGNSARSASPRQHSSSESPAVNGGATEPEFVVKREEGVLSGWGRPATVARRMLHVSDLVLRDRLAMMVAVLNDLVNAGGVFVLLYYYESLFPLVALVISDAAKFVLTRGRGLVFAVVALAAAALLTVLPAISIAMQVINACHSNAALCHIWRDAAFADPLSGSVFLIFGIFLAAWFFAQIQFVLQFVAAHVVGQCYGSNSVSMDEDDIHSVIRAAKCAFNESFGSISLLSLISVAALGASFVLNLLFMGSLGDSVLAALPVALNALAFFAFSLFLSCFVLPLMALTGQSFSEALRSAVSLLQRNLVVAVAFTLASLCVVGVIVLVVFFALTFAGGVSAMLIAATGAPHWGVPLGIWWASISVMLVGTSVCALTLFHWVLNITISTLFLCLALEGKANQSTLTTPLSVDN